MNQHDATSRSPRPGAPRTGRALLMGLGVGVIGVVVLVLVILRGGKKDETPAPDGGNRDGNREPIAGKEKDGDAPKPADGPPKKPPPEQREPRAMYEDISSVQTWEAARGPYLLGRSIRVRQTGGLRIERGTLILAAEGAGLVVSGRLETFGDPARFVRFRPQREGESWGGIALVPYNTDKVVPNRISHVDVRGANVGLSSHLVPVTLERCVFAHNGTGVSIQTSEIDERRLSDCLLTHNRGDGLKLRGYQRVTVSMTTLSHNGGAGLVLEKGGSPSVNYCELSNNAVGLRTTGAAGKPELRFCNFRGNRKAAVEVTTDADFACNRCFWGTTRPEEVAALLLDGEKTPGRGRVRRDGVAPTAHKLAGTKLTLTEP